jgi:uncharacterized protein YeaO (DUF488 family)
LSCFVDARRAVVVITDSRRQRGRSLRFEVERVYDVGDHDRYRVLVDRLWPRGITKEHASLDEWAKDVAPSSELRRWYGHDPGRFDEFTRRYRAELTRSPASEAVARLIDVAATRRVAQVTATRDVDHSGARVLCDHLIAREPARTRR